MAAKKGKRTAPKKRSSKKLTKSTETVSASGTGEGARRRYSDAERQNILATAKREGLTAAKVKERFGVTPVTYYSWRKKSASAKGKPSGRAAAAGEVVGRTVAGAMNVADAIREEIRAHIRKILPGILASELDGGADRGSQRRKL